MRRLVTVLSALALVLAVAMPAWGAQARTRLVSKTSAGQPADYHSFEGVISGDGRFVAFTSAGENLPRANGYFQIYIHDRRTGATRLISKTSSGDPAGNDSDDPSISADGRFVAFQSDADNLPGLPAQQDVYLHDRRAGTTRLMSKTTNGVPADDESSSPSISGNGRFVAFRSDAANLGGDPAYDDIFIHDSRTGRTRLVSKTSNGEAANEDSEDPAVSHTGRFVSFDSTAFNLPAGDGTFRIYVHDRKTGKTRLVSKRSNGVPADAGSFDSTISSSGRFVAFESVADNMPGLDGVRDVYVHDRRTGRTQLVSRASSGAPADAGSDDVSISASGRWAVFESAASNLGGGSVHQDVFLRDLARARTRLVSRTSQGEALSASAEGIRGQRLVSDDGRFVVFTTDAAELPGEDNYDSVYVRGPLR